MTIRGSFDTGEVEGMVPASWLLDEKARRQKAEAECGRLREQLDAAQAEIGHYRRALVAHHNIANVSDAVLREYDYRSCPVCARAALGVAGEAADE